MEFLWGGLRMIRFFGNLLKEKVLPFAHVTKLIKSIDESFPWKPKVPSRVAYFVWTVALGNILTVDNIWKQKILILDCYCMCKRNGELVDHLLAPLLLICGLWSLSCLAFTGLCQRWWWSCWLVGKESLGGIGMVLFGWLSFVAWCGAFGERGITVIY